MKSSNSNSNRTNSTQQTPMVQDLISSLYPLNTQNQHANYAAMMQHSQWNVSDHHNTHTLQAPHLLSTDLLSLNSPTNYEEIFHHLSAPTPMVNVNNPRNPNNNNNPGNNPGANHPTSNIPSTVYVNPLVNQSNDSDDLLTCPSFPPDGINNVNKALLEKHKKVSDTTTYGPPEPEPDPAAPSFPESLILDWELYRQRVETEWRLSLLEKEKQLRDKLEAEYQTRFQHALEDLKRLQQEVSKLELRLKASLETVEREKSLIQHQQQELQRQLREKTLELQMYSRKYKSEAKELVEQERLEKATLKKQLALMTQQSDALEKKYTDLLEQYNRIQLKLDQSDQKILKEQLMEARTALARNEALLESELKQKAILTLEKEQYRSQVYNLASCLKKERELTNLKGRQELEKLRLEFLMREERFILDGDRHVFDSIKRDLKSLS